MTATTGSITNSQWSFNGQQASLTVNLSGNAYANYTWDNVPVFAPYGLFSKPLPNSFAILQLSPNGTTGYVSGFGNPAPDPTKSTNNVSGIIGGEVAICEMSGYNFNIQAKVDKLISIFTNSNNQQITSNIGISENVVTALIDVFNEIVALETAYNQLISTYNGHTHLVTGVEPGGGTVTSNATLNTGSTYTATSNFDRDKSFLNQSPSKMYINLNGAIIS